MVTQNKNFKQLLRACLKTVIWITSLVKRRRKAVVSWREILINCVTKQQLIGLPI